MEQFIIAKTENITMDNSILYFNPGEILSLDKNVWLFHFFMMNLNKYICKFVR